MTVIVSRCTAPPEAVYEALMVAVLRRGGAILMGEWGSSLLVAHGPPHPSLRHGSRRIALLRVQADRDVCRIEGVLEQRYGNYYGVAGSILAAATPFLTLFSPLPGIATGIASALLTLYTLTTVRIDVNWLSSLIEEACEYSHEFEENTREHTTSCRIECGLKGDGALCTIEPIDGDEFLLLALNLIGFRAGEGWASNGSIRVTYKCEERRCNLYYESSFLAPRVTPESAALITTLLSKILC